MYFPHIEDALDAWFTCDRCRELSNAIRLSGVMPRLIESLPALPFEARKDVSQVRPSAFGQGGQAS